MASFPAIGLQCPQIPILRIYNPYRDPVALQAEKVIYNNILCGQNPFTDPYFTSNFYKVVLRILRMFT